VAESLRENGFFALLGHGSIQPPHGSAHYCIIERNKAARYGTAHVENVFGIILALCPL